MTKTKIVPTFTRFVSQTITLCIATSNIWNGANALAATESASISTQDQSNWQTIKSKLRVRTFSEYMTPSANSNESSSIPSPDGSPVSPTNISNVAWADYEVAPNYRILYWQRFAVNLTSSEPFNTVNTFITRNPRFALRRTQLFNSSLISSTYDFYIQPGLASEAFQKGRDFEFGFRTNTGFSPADSRWSFGAITEFTVSLSKSSNIANRTNSYGWVMPWVSYKLSRIFYTQHFVTVNFKHQEEDAWNNFSLDTYMPFIQNGIGVNLSDQFSASLLINNYLTTAPTLQNTWASVWLSMAFL